jgi:Flp pilus assembly pilin Flp
VSRVATIRAFCHDLRGMAAVEFALIAPVLLIAMMGVFDLSYTMYINSMLTGAIQKSARDSTIEGAAASAAVLDQRVTNAVRVVVYQSALTFERKSYSNFSDVARPEDFTDVDSDGACNNGEPFEDANGNGNWDKDRGTTGFGGARDAVLYTVKVTYERPFPIAKLLGQDNTFTLKTQTVLRNQPYGLQNAEAPATENCT